ncbi:MAG: domain S-box protein [Bradyrhizobium sp.]|jgi:diguanylate cyclase (GGDEF)-like protein/PAS domain S-box-containing protein|nr:domain S-box protein [Bradyrhizobium sp.]
MMASTSGKRRLLRLVSPFVAVILFQAFLAGLSLETLSSVRAYVGGEGLWSKGQKDAIHFISLYSQTGDEEFYSRFKSALAVPLADRAARYALEQRTPDLKAAQGGFMGGGNHPDDIPGMIWLFRNFQDVPYMAMAIRHWRATDPFLDQLASLGDAIHEDFSSATGIVGRADRKEQIDLIDGRLAPFARAFSESLGEGSRAIKFLLTVANFLTAICLVFLIVWHTRKMMKQRLTFENALKVEKERAQVTLASLGEAVITTDADGRLNYMNPMAERLTGCAISEASGSPLNSLFSIVDESTGEANDQLIYLGRCDGVTLDRQLLVRRDSSEVAVSIVGAPLHSDGQAAGMVLVLHDMTSEREFVARLSWQASHDALTGLVNRREFETRLGKAIDKLSRETSEHSLMFLDLDQFKVVNDTCGHAAGDQLLKQTSDLLQDNLGIGGLLARLGGDEFGILLQDCEASSAVGIAERLRLAVQELRFVWNGCAFNISVSIGLVHVAKANAMEETLRAADMACYMAKEKGRNRVQVYHPSDSELVQRVGEMAWVQRIRNGLDEQRFCLFAQEIRALNKSEPDRSCFELLLRLRDEDGKLVQPGSFIPAAERYGLMPLIDRWVVRNAFALLASRLNSSEPAQLSSCAINLSGTTFSDDDFIDYVRRQFEIHQIPPELICFEITETSAIANLSSARRFIQALKRLGCRFSLDDFGTGMSSFSYLKHLPVDHIKIDGSFVTEMLNSDVDRAMVESIVHIARVMGKRTIAEFVESNEILEALRKIGVDYAQGYAIGKPSSFESAYPLTTNARREVA